MSWAETMLLFLLFALSIPHFSQAWSVDYPSPIANAPSQWTNNNATIPYNATYADGSMIRAILVRQNPAGYAPSFACGFICAAPCNGAFLFAVFSVSIAGSSTGAPANATATPRVVWAANRHHPVKENASVQLTKDGNLILRDFDGSLVWSTNTLRGPVVGVNLADTGNLILFDVMGKTVWESFEHPTDTLLIGQSLRQGKRLTAASSNLSQGQFYLTVLDHGLYAFIDADTPQSYYQKKFNVTDAVVRSKMNISSDEEKNATAYISLLQGSLSAFVSLGSTRIKLFNISLPWPSSAQLMSLQDDGHLRLYGWNGLSWKSLAGVLNVDPEECAYPTVCGEYGICSEGQCSCPTGNPGDTLFRQLDDRQPNLGCSPTTPLSCDLIQYQRLLPLPDVTYFNFAHDWTTDEESCMGACLKACSCKAVFFRHENASYGSCYHVGVPVLVVLICVLLIFIKRAIAKRMQEDDPFKGIPGMPTRFSYKQFLSCRLLLLPVNNNPDVPSGQCLWPAPHPDP